MSSYIIEMVLGFGVVLSLRSDFGFASDLEGPLSDFFFFLARSNK